MPNTTVSQMQFENTGPLLDIKPLVDYIYPIGAVYISTTLVDPAVLFGGTWSRIEGKFLLSADGTYTAGTTGGSSTVTLSTTEIPSHTHTGPSHTHTGPSHTHGLNGHTHTGPSHTHSGPNHSHGLNGHTHGVGSIYAVSNGNHSHAVPMHTCDKESGGYGLTQYWAFQNRIFVTAGNEVGTTGGGAHTHSCSGSTGGNSGSTTNAGTGATGAAGTGNTGGNSGNTTASGTGATGTAGTGNTSATGGGGAHNNMPPYLSVYMWERTA